MKQCIFLAMTMTALAGGCGNPTLLGDCAPKKSEKESPFFLADTTGAPSLQSLPGGFLVYDEIATDTFSKTGDLAGSLSPNRKCSSSLIPRKKNGKTYFEVISAENCLRPFVWGAINQRILLSIPGSNDYVDFKVSDARVRAVPKLYALFAPLPLKARTRAVDNSFIESSTGQSQYIDDIKVMKEQQANDFAASQCWKFGKATPDPENCLWLRGSRSDLIEVDVPSKYTHFFESLADSSTQFEKSSVTQIDAVVPNVSSKLMNFRSGRLAFASVYDDYAARMSAYYWIDCDDALPTDFCFGLTITQRKTLSLAIIGLYQPSRIAEFEAAFNAPDRAASKKIMQSSIRRDIVEGVRTTLAPALEAYFSMRVEFDRHKDLISVLSNHLEGTKLEPRKFSYRSLSPFASKVPEPLKGIAFTFNQGNILLSHPGAPVNQNLALDGHIGSVVAFGGLPILGFSPANIDQSDRASEMPLPRTTERADVPTKESKTGDTAKNPAKKGSGSKDGGC